MPVANLYAKDCSVWLWIARYFAYFQDIAKFVAKFIKIKRAIQWFDYQQKEQRKP